MTEASDLPVLLIVEDDEGLQRQLKWAYDGYRVVCAGDRGSAIEALRACRRTPTGPRKALRRCKTFCG